MDTTEDIWRYVLSGGKIRCQGSAPDEYVESVDGRLVDETGVEVSYTFAYPAEWGPWEPPTERVPQERWSLLFNRGGERSLEGLYPSEEAARVALASMGKDRDNLIDVARVLYLE